MSAVQIARVIKEGEYTITVDCPFCPKHHLHGKTDYTVREGYGSRGSHCRPGGSYVILRKGHGPIDLGRWGGVDA